MIGLVLNQNLGQDLIRAVFFVWRSFERGAVRANGVPEDLKKFKTLNFKQKLQTSNKNSKHVLVQYVRTTKSQLYVLKY